jgi:hypothetical protein
MGIGNSAMKRTVFLIISMILSPLGSQVNWIQPEQFGRDPSEMLLGEVANQWRLGIQQGLDTSWNGQLQIAYNLAGLNDWRVTLQGSSALGLQKSWPMYWSLGLGVKHPWRGSLYGGLSGLESPTLHLGGSQKIVPGVLFIGEYSLGEYDQSQAWGLQWKGDSLFSIATYLSQSDRVWVWGLQERWFLGRGWSIIVGTENRPLRLSLGVEWGFGSFYVQSKYEMHPELANRAGFGLGQILRP